MVFRPSGFYVRPDLTMVEKIGIVIIFLIALIDSLLINYLVSTDISEFEVMTAGVAKWVQDNLSCSGSWVRASMLYQEKMYLIYSLAIASILIVCIVVVLSTPRKQLSVWAQDVSVSQALLLIFIHVAGLSFLMCFVGDAFTLGDLHEKGKFRFIFNSYLGLVLIVSVMGNVFSYYSTLSVLLFGVLLRK